jgi:hypothetical protein
MPKIQQTDNTVITWYLYCTSYVLNIISFKVVLKQKHNNG